MSKGTDSGGSKVLAAFSKGLKVERARPLREHWLKMFNLHRGEILEVQARKKSDGSLRLFRFSQMAGGGSYEVHGTVGVYDLTVVLYASMGDRNNLRQIYLDGIVYVQTPDGVRHYAEEQEVDRLTTDSIPARR